MAAMTGRQKPSTLWIMQGAFLLGTLMYVAVAVVLNGRVDPPGAEGIAADSPLGMILVGAGVLVAALSTLVPRMIPALEPGAQAGASDYLAACVRRLVITNAMLEIPAILGLVGAILGLPLTPIVLLLALSVAGMLAMAPRISGWISEYESRQGREPRHGEIR